MKVSEAEKLIGPFMSKLTSQGLRHCITDKCMAWEMTKTDEIVGYSREIDKEGNQVPYVDELPHSDCEGYYRR